MVSYLGDELVGYVNSPNPITNFINNPSTNPITKPITNTISNPIIGGYCPSASIYPTICPKGYFCVGGVSAADPCLPGSYGNSTALKVGASDYTFLLPLFLFNPKLVNKSNSNRNNPNPNPNRLVTNVRLVSEGLIAMDTV
jgi:hypothetical protein